MDCSEVQNRLAAYVMNETSIHHTRVIARHLSACDVCRDWHQDVLEMAEIWEQDVQSQPTPDLVTPVLQRLGLSEDIVRIPSSLRLMHFGIAACLALFLFNLGVFEHVGMGIHKINAQVSFILQDMTHK